MKLLKRKKCNRSIVANFGNYIILTIFGLFFFLPMLFIISNAFKPLDELFVFPPRFFAKNPTLSNFGDLFMLMQESLVPFTRYLFNTLVITVVGTFGHIFISSLAAYILAKVRPPLSNGIFKLIVTTLMFSTAVTAIPNYLIMSALHLVDSYWAIIIPAWGGTMGLFLMKQFMDDVPDSLVEAARIDGSGIIRTYWSIIMPNVKPGWITLLIFSFQALWANTGGSFLYSEVLKPLPYALTQITSSGIARAGVGAAISLLLLIVPVVMFVITQSNIIETMTSSGIKE